MSRFLSGTRYLILIPIFGLAIAAATFFILGGLGLIRLLLETIAALGMFVGLRAWSAKLEKDTITSRERMKKDQAQKVDQ